MLHTVRGVASACALVGGVCCAKPTPPAPPDPALAHIGVWYGTGMAFPEGQLCLVFCPNARFFAADTTCDDTAHADFQRDWTWSRATDGTLQATRGDGQAMGLVFQPQTPDDALFLMVGHPGLPLSRIGLLSPACLR